MPELPGASRRPALPPLVLRDHFPPVDRAAWEDRVRADLKGADYETTLVWSRRTRGSAAPCRLHIRCAASGRSS